MEKEKINIRIGNFLFPSVESALQGIKFSEQNKREEVFGLSGMKALKEGRKITRSIVPDKINYVFWEGKKMVYGSIKHRLLIAMFIAEKVRQNPRVQEALLATRGTFIYHDVSDFNKEDPNTSLPEKFFVEILLAQRKLLKRIVEKIP